MASFNVITRESARCYADSYVIMTVAMRQSRGHGAWEVEVVDVEQHRNICSAYEDEALARAAVELAYSYGRQFGQWKIDRAVDYRPTGIVVSPEGWDDADVARTHAGGAAGASPLS
jgi:hypothetical protein